MMADTADGYNAPQNGELRALGDPKIRERIVQAERAVTAGKSNPSDTFITAQELGVLIDDLRAGRRPAILEDEESSGSGRVGILG